MLIFFFCYMTCFYLQVMEGHNMIIECYYTLCQLLKYF